ncbi:MAG: hypothetical protein VX776_07975 [Planctomycetota bacterium]|nr:hypothetical protein [Planctomycetota bacterium]
MRPQQIGSNYFADASLDSAPRIHSAGCGKDLGTIELAARGSG